MTEELKKFIEKAQQDEQLKTELEALEKTAEGKNPVEARGELARAVVAISKEHGFALTEEDFRLPDGKLDDAELAAVAGGNTGGCGCVLVGGGAGAGKKDSVFVCLCALSGASITGASMCGCILAGEGE